MSETADNNVLKRIAHTPMRDVVRGRLTGRMNWRHLIRSSGLPAPARQCVHRVVRRMWLERLEKAEVASELVAHFADGLEAGQTIEQLIDSFGDERQAARLIARGKRRARSLPAQTRIVARRLMVTLILSYLVLGIYFNVGTPSPTIDYIALLNAPLENVAPDQRAWPVYRETLLAIGARDRQAQVKLNQLLDARPGSPGWPELVGWLQDHAPVLKLIRTGAERPVLGFVHGPGGSANDPALRPADPQSETELPLASIRLPYLNEMRMLSMVLAADTQLAIEKGDGARAEQNIGAMIEMAEQARDGFLINQLVSTGLRSAAIAVLQDVLAHHPRIFSDGMLTRMAHRIAEPDQTSELFSTSGESMLFHDTVQRLYTHDGNDDGRLTRRGFEITTNLGAISGEPLAVVVGPASLLVAASRQEVLREYDKWLDLVEAQWRKPLHEVQPNVLETRFRGLWESIGYAPLASRTQSFELVHENAERYLGLRDGTLIGIAIELYRRRHDEYPATLDALMPDLIPVLSVDRITGAPLKYRLADGRPVVYSVGGDLDDDGGRPPVLNPYSAALWHQAPESIPDGDWILYPPLPAPTLRDVDE